MSRLYVRKSPPKKPKIIEVSLLEILQIKLDHSIFELFYFQALGLIGDFSNEIRKCLVWAVQFEKDPLVRTESCHSIILLIKNKKDQELVDILHERHLVEEEPIVRK